MIAQADGQTLSALIEAVRPLLEEISSVLDALVARPHPLPDDQEILEYGLNDLGQAGVEARLELETRRISV